MNGPLVLKLGGELLETPADRARIAALSASTAAHRPLVISVAAGIRHTVGLRSDGTVVAVGRNDSGECNVDDWNNIIQVAAGYFYTLGVGSDSTVVAVGDNEVGQCNVGG